VWGGRNRRGPKRSKTSSTQSFQCMVFGGSQEVQHRLGEKNRAANDREGQEGLKNVKGEERRGRGKYGLEAGSVMSKYIKGCSSPLDTQDHGSQEKLREGKPEMGGGLSK